MSSTPVHVPFWHDAAFPSLTPLQKHWLLRPGALTAGLRQLGRLELRVIREYGCGAPADEASALQLPVRSPVWVREIVMSLDGTDAVAARSLTPLAASHSVWQGIRRLRSRPLADMLYHDRTITRSPFAISRLRSPTAFQSALRLQQHTQLMPAELLARRSVFWRYGLPLMVAECFLPAFWKMATKL